MATKSTRSARGRSSAARPRTAPKRKAAAKPAPKRPRAARKTAAKKTAATRRRARSKPASRAIVPAAPSRDAPRWTETLDDGTRVLIRPIHKEDAALEHAFIRRLSPESRRLRFLGQMSEPSEELLRALTDIDYRRDVAFIALVHRDGEKQEIGVARYGTSPDGRICECAVTVGDEWRNRGLGTLLMRHLIDVARARGVRSMISLDAADNLAMRDLASFLGFRRKRDPKDPTQVVHTLSLQ